MSVYTRLTKEELEQLLKHYHIGNFVGIEGINEGITNSNYYLTTSHNKYILTILHILEILLSLFSLVSIWVCPLTYSQRIVVVSRRWARITETHVASSRSWVRGT